MFITINDLTGHSEQDFNLVIFSETLSNAKNVENLQKYILRYYNIEMDRRDLWNLVENRGDKVEYLIRDLRQLIMRY